MSNRKYKTIKNRSHSSIYALLILLAVVVIAASGGIALLVLNIGVGNVNDNSEVSVAVTISGDDLIVKVLNDGRIDELDVIHLSISGINLVDNIAYKSVPNGGGDIVYNKITYGITGDHQVLIKGYFSDNSENILLVKTVNFGG